MILTIFKGELVLYDSDDEIIYQARCTNKELESVFDEIREKLLLELS